MYKPVKSKSQVHFEISSTKTINYNRVWPLVYPLEAALYEVLSSNGAQSVILFVAYPCTCIWSPIYKYPLLIECGVSSGFNLVII